MRNDTKKLWSVAKLKILFEMNAGFIFPTGYQIVLMKHNETYTPVI